MTVHDATLRLLRLDRASISREIDASGELARQVAAVLGEGFAAGGALGVLGVVAGSPWFDAPADAEDAAQAWTRAAYAMLVAAEQYVADRRLGADEFAQFLRRSWIGEAERDHRPNELPGLLTGSVRCYCALYTGDLGRDAAVAVIDSLALRSEAVVRKLARRAALAEDGLPLATLLEQNEIGLGADLRGFARRTLFGDGLRERIIRATARASDYTAANLNALVLLLLKLAAAVP